MADEPDFGADCVGVAHETGHVVGVLGGLTAAGAVGYEAYTTGVGETQPAATSAAVGGAYELGQHVADPLGQVIGYGGCEAVDWGKEQIHELNTYFNTPPDTTSPPAISDGFGWNFSTTVEPTHANASIGNSWMDASQSIAITPTAEVVSVEPASVTTPSIFDNGHSVFDSTPSWGGDSGSHASYDGFGSHDSGNHDSGTGIGDSGSSV